MHEKRAKFHPACVGYAMRPEPDTVNDEDKSEQGNNDGKGNIDDEDPEGLSGSEVGFTDDEDEDEQIHEEEKSEGEDKRNENEEGESDLVEGKSVEKEEKQKKKKKKKRLEQQKKVPVASPRPVSSASLAGFDARWQSPIFFGYTVMSADEEDEELARNFSEEAVSMEIKDTEMETLQEAAEQLKHDTLHDARELKSG